MSAKQAEQEEKDVDTGADRKSQDERPYSLINYKLEAINNKKTLTQSSFQGKYYCTLIILGKQTLFTLISPDQTSACP